MTDQPHPAPLRRADASDVPVIHDLLCAMAAAEGGAIRGTPDSLMTHGFGPLPRFRVILATGDPPLGLILYFPEYSSWRGQMGLYVQDLYLRPAARGRGLGRALLAAALRDAAADPQWQPQFATLMVAQNNHAARAFYTSMGFARRDSADPLILADQGLAALIAPV